ncbi:MAG: putative serine/threonine-protein kinase unc-51, partial [Streblomastix strix]
PELGIVAAKVVLNKFFSEDEWNIAGILSEDPSQECPFIIKNILARKFEDMTIIILQYCNCKTLYDLIAANKDIPLSVVRVIMKQIMEGLCFIHSKGLIHRDIKPGNILLHSLIGSGRVIAKIADFGDVKINPNVDQLSMFLSFKGTHVYMPPEIILGDQNQLKVASSKVDMWSAGIILYRLLTHTFPFHSTNDIDIKQFMEDKVLIRPPSVVDNDLWDFLRRLLCFNRKDRISASDALQHPFFTNEQRLLDKRTLKLR